MGVNADCEVVHDALANMSHNSHIKPMGNTTSASNWAEGKPKLHFGRQATADLRTSAYALASDVTGITEALLCFPECYEYTAYMTDIMK